LLVTYRGQRAAASGRAPAPLRRHHRSGGSIVAASEALWAALVREGYDEELLSFIHPGVEMKVLSSSSGSPGLRAEARRDLGCDEGSDLVGMVAILDRDRGAATLLEAAAILLRERARARFVIVGDGARRASLEARAGRLGIAERVRFTGWREDVPRVLRALDAFVYPGEGEEVFPASLIEAMAASIPVVAGDQPGIREILENGKQGLIVPEKGSASLARTIHRVLSDREEALKMGRAGAVRVQRFHTRAMVDAHEALYYRVSKIARGS
jgi:glycosyltransferase involved in cell wall biosynthesis